MPLHSSPSRRSAGGDAAHRRAALRLRQSRQNRRHRSQKPHPRGHPQAALGFPLPSSYNDGSMSQAQLAAGPVSQTALLQAANLSPGMFLPALSLARRELVRFLRQRHRIIGALATPLVFWLLVGGGFGRSLSLPNSPPGQSFIHFFFPGTLVMILLFTAIFSTISVIEDRREGFLQGVLVAPVSRHAIALGKILGGTALATGQGLLFLALSPLVGFRYG